jgi:hypothetical protein
VEAVVNNELLSGWNADLGGAFGILLGAPLDAFDPTATYAFYHWDEFLDAEFYRGLDPADLLSAEVRRPSDLAEPWHPAFRHSDTGSEMSWTRFGFDLGRSVFRVDEEMLRVDVDDEIAGFSGDVITALEWEEALRTIDHTPLRDHLRNLCLTQYWAGSHGGCYDGSQISNEFACLAGQRHRPVAGWHFGHAQAASAIFQLR